MGKMVIVIIIVLTMQLYGDILNICGNESTSCLVH